MVKVTVSLLCVRAFARKGCPQNDLYCVGWNVKPYSLTHVRAAIRTVSVTTPLE